MRRLTPVLVLAASAAFTAGCDFSTSSGGDDKLGAARIESFLQEEFRGIEVTGVQCSELDERDGTQQFRCAATVMGAPIELNVEAADEDRLVRTEAVLDVAKVEAFVVQQYDEQVGVTVTAECSADPVLVATPGDVVDCTVVDSAGTSQAPRVTVENLDGDISLELA